ncbi:prepilin-type N-terminal cleavage/methylation domain-containing protein [Dyella sp. AtDHG13]|uniref:prepilin-type N-terminal cleavage/methylation domain-containing protein n=1 Tax=Dyella sp. AtDHG13 TaxID=1938897 RepID=UPI001F159959|nr:prepilin-type N-terminal cleavage/methylation domain-containing protein [Dyella sp. AtDHG13]
MRGFSLLEVIAAILLLAVAFAALLKVAGASLHLADHSGQISRADMWAQAKLDALGVTEPVAVGESAGDFGKDYRWHLRVRPWQDGDPPQGSPLSLYRVDLDVRWGSSRRPQVLHYTTLRAVDDGPALARSTK